MGDRRDPALTGVGIGYTVLAVAALSRSAYQAFTGPPDGRSATAVALSAVSGLVYVVAAVGLRRGSPAGLRLGRTCLVVELVGVVTVSAVELLIGGFGRATVWSGLGVGYGFAPVVLPILGLWLLRRRAHRVRSASPREEASESPRA